MPESAYPLHWLHLARVVVECASPLSIGTGAADGVFDVALVRDANGLPAIPGSSLAGVLRHAWRRLGGGVEEEARIFGFQRPRGPDGEAEGQASRLQVSWGALLDSEGRAAEGVLLGKDARRLEADPLLAFARQTAEAPVFRDRVRLSHRGTADDRGKFDRSVLPAGFRFAFELALWSGRGDDPAWHRVLGLLGDPLLRLGAGTRAGLGALRIVRCHARSFDLATAAGRAGYLALGPALDDVEGLEPLEIAAHAPPRDGGDRHLRLRLRPRGAWCVGQGEESLLERRGAGRPEKPADRLPLTERRVEWDATGRGRLGLHQLLLPASALKGALAHRVAFHDNRLRGVWAEDMPPEALAGYEKSERSEAVRELFGYARGDGREPGGRAGRVFVEDAWMPVEEAEVIRMMHNAIDRFSGGVRRHMLYEEELVWGGTLELGILVAGWSGLSPPTRAAFRHALEDLLAGRLALGGGTGRGHGFVTGEVLADTHPAGEAAA